MKKQEFYLLEVSKIRGIDGTDFCLVFTKANKRKIYLLNYPEFKILYDFNYFRRIIFN